MKKPTLKEKVQQYESFLHRINSFIICSCNEGIAELVQNADNWSYAHRVGNGEITEAQQERIINNAFWKLCDTPKTDKEIEELQLLRKLKAEDESTKKQ